MATSSSSKKDSDTTVTTGSNAPAQPQQIPAPSDEVLAAASTGQQPQTSEQLAEQDPALAGAQRTPEEEIAHTREVRDAAGMDQRNVPQDNAAVSMLPPLPGEYVGKNIDPRVIPQQVWDDNPGYDRAAAINAYDEHQADRVTETGVKRSPATERR